jgi:hypothetical protein
MGLLGDLAHLFAQCACLSNALVDRFGRAATAPGLAAAGDFEAEWS